MFPYLQHKDDEGTLLFLAILRDTFDPILGTLWHQLEKQVAVG